MNSFKTRLRGGWLRTLHTLWSFISKKSLQARFLPRHFFLRVARTLFKVLCVSLNADNPSNIQNVVVRRIKNFLEFPKVNELIQNSVERVWLRTFQTLWSITSNKSLQAHFLPRHFFSTRRTNLIQSALCFPELRQPFKYTERYCTTNKKFFRAPQGRWSHSKLDRKWFDSERLRRFGVLNGFIDFEEL